MTKIRKLHALKYRLSKIHYRSCLTQYLVKEDSDANNFVITDTKYIVSPRYKGKKNKRKPINFGVIGVCEYGPLNNPIGIEEFFRSINARN